MQAIDVYAVAVQRSGVGPPASPNMAAIVLIVATIALAVVAAMWLRRRRMIAPQHAAPRRQSPTTGRRPPASAESDTTSIQERLRLLSPDLNRAPHDRPHRDAQRPHTRDRAPAAVQPSPSAASSSGSQLDRDTTSDVKNMPAVGAGTRRAGPEAPTYGGSRDTYAPRVQMDTLPALPPRRDAAPRNEVARASDDATHYASSDDPDVPALRPPVAPTRYFTPEELDLDGVPMDAAANGQTSMLPALPPRQHRRP